MGYFQNSDKKGQIKRKKIIKNKDVKGGLENIFFIFNVLLLQCNSAKNKTKK